MEKSAIRSVAWNARIAGYQISEQTDQGTITTPVNGESSAWNEWLSRMPSFAFHSRDGRHFTAVKERRGHGGAYWIAYRSVAGTLKRKYLGTPARITLAQLEQVALALSESKPQTQALHSLSPNDAPTAVRPDGHSTPWPASLPTTKFFLPTSSHALIARPRLLALLQQGLQRKLTLVSAPAGFGKTTLVAAWLRSLAEALPKHQPQVAWVGLESADNDPIRFWTAVLTALEQRAPGSGQHSLALLHAQPTHPLAYVLTTLINQLAQTQTPWLVVLDDYQVISEPAIHAQLSYLLEHQPPSVHLILLSRTDPPLSLPRLRARDQVLEVRTEHLRVTVEGTMAFFQDVMGIELPEAALQEITTRTEGWWVGLQLLGLSLRYSADPVETLEELGGSQRYILDYLVEEVLQQQPAAVQRFLLQTSILEQLCAPLCDAVTREPGSQHVLEELERDNVFVVPLDGHRRWYRYHALFAEALHYQLEQQHADEVDGLHVRASAWYAEQGNTCEAIQHALLAHTWQLAADLIEQGHVSLLWNEGLGDAATLRQWLSQFPEEVIRARPQLCLAYAQVLHSAAPPATVEAWLQAAEATLAASLSQTTKDSQERADQQNLLGEIVAWRARLGSEHGQDAEAVLALCQQALALLVPQNLAVRAEVLWTQSVSSFAAGEASAASQSALAAARLAQEADKTPAAIACLSAAAPSLMACGRLHEAWRVLERAGRLGQQPSSLELVYAQQAELLREWNRLDEALSLATRALEWGKPRQTPTALVAEVLLARVALARGDLEAARAAFQRSEQIRENVEHPHGLDWVSSGFSTVPQMQLWLAQGAMSVAAHWAEDVLAQQGSVSLMRRQQEEVALIRLLLAQARPTEALMCLMPLVECAERQERWGQVIELRLLQAQAQLLLQQEQAALACLAQAVQLAAPEGYVRLFVEEGPLLKTLVSRLREQERGRGPTPYLDTLLAAFPAHEQARKPCVSQQKLGLLEPLSTRELDVLQQMAAGASNQEIAERLVITVDTVKRHVGNILGKLQANNRTQAAALARTLGLLADKAP